MSEMVERRVWFPGHVFSPVLAREAIEADEAKSGGRQKGQVYSANADDGGHWVRYEIEMP